MNAKKTPLRAGQVAIENLILYGAVILVVLIVLVVIWQTGVFKPPTGRKGFIGFSQILPTDWIVSRSNVVWLGLKSEGDAPLYIEVEWINVTFPRLECELGPVLEPGENNVTLQPGDTYVFKINCPGLVDEYELGDEYEMDVTVNYTNTISGRRHISVGKIYGFMEFVDEDWVPPTTTTTTIVTQPECFYHPCNKTGEFDPENCGDIIYGQGPQECIYCPERPEWFPPGEGPYCWYNGKCGEACSVNNDCGPDIYLNLCKECVDNVCTESAPDEPCGPCPPSDYGTFDSEWCNVTLCPYCYHTWVQRSGIIGDGYDLYTCTENDSCGESCENLEFDDYAECQVRCTHCENVSGIGVCTQGDCGKRCGPGAPIDECELGCAWCNNTGPDPSYRCEMGDCGKPCGPDNPSQTCELGCDVCHQRGDGSWVCVKKDIGVTIIAHNGTIGGKVVREDQLIYLDVTGQADDGIQRLIVSDGTPLKQETYSECGEWADARNTLGQIDDPFADPWFPNNDILWMGNFTCMPPQNPICSHRWTTTESEVNKTCYFALAQKYSPSGHGRWSLLVADYMQVGLINVYLVSPRPM